MGNKNFIGRAMRNSGNTDYRPEQMYCKDLLNILFKPIIDIDEIVIELEYRVTDLRIDGKPTNDAIPDIVIIGKKKKFAIRMQGAIHYTSESRGIKDDWQRIALEEAGWIVVDLSEDNIPELWERKSDEDFVTNKLRKIILKEYKNARV